MISFTSQIAHLKSKISVLVRLDILYSILDIQDSFIDLILITDVCNLKKEAPSRGVEGTSQV